jgi:hypothetical protein
LFPTTFSLNAGHFPLNEKLINIIGDHTREQYIIKKYDYFLRSNIIDKLEVV